jgi:aminoglycoside 6'-N-acetyltransferase-1b
MEVRMHFTFEPLTEADLPLHFEWLKRPHVADRWSRADSLAELREEYLPQQPGRWSARPFLALLDGTPAGYIQVYVAYGANNRWWPGESDPTVRGIDQFLANAADLGRGLGTMMIRDFAAFVFADVDVSRIIADPAPDNTRALRCYEKAGFRRVGRLVTPDGPAVLMVLDRP